MVNVKSGNRVVSCFVVEPAATTFDLADLHRGPVASTEVGAALMSDCGRRTSGLSTTRLAKMNADNRALHALLDPRAESIAERLLDVSSCSARGEKLRVTCGVSHCGIVRGCGERACSTNQLSSVGASKRASIAWSRFADGTVDIRRCGRTGRRIHTGVWFGRSVANENDLRSGRASDGRETLAALRIEARKVLRPDRRKGRPRQSPPPGGKRAIGQERGGAGPSGLLPRASLLSGLR